jgi:hypothetical protein
VSEPVKRIVLSRFWVNEWIYHRVHGERGLITGVQFATDRLIPRYYCVFNENSDGWMDEMELTAEPVVSGVPTNG